jgi:hypothetical protein
LLKIVINRTEPFREYVGFARSDLKEKLIVWHFATDLPQYINHVSEWVNDDGNSRTMVR